VRTAVILYYVSSVLSQLSLLLLAENTAYELPCRVPCGVYIVFDNCHIQHILSLIIYVAQLSCHTVELSQQRMTFVTKIGDDECDKIAVISVCVTQL